MDMKAANDLDEEEATKDDKDLLPKWIGGGFGRFQVIESLT